ncbi:hypothetical protein C8A00DRAFT_18957 [Chaetomidium leptoderma]|uniref:Uncharacterized protein n=1 Tax=Chaetomidium leptoderma TaxID=669021 RepID=A0AAN6VF24_9PEZI|nr:hypothetical protein C8A00DRAFT_18957 [Chaetomidium leptoderma]
MERPPARLPFRQPATPQAIGPRPTVPCRFFARGACRNGRTCLFLHDTGVPQDKSTTAPDRSMGALRQGPQGKVSRSLVPCRFYLMGTCREGDGCPFAHPHAEAGATSTERCKSTVEKPDDCIRGICGAAVQFGAGAAVLKTSLQSDFSAVRLSMLPPGSSPATISRLLLDTFGFPVAPECIRVPPQEDTAHCIADVLVEDPSFAKRLCTAISSVRADTAAPQMAAVQINAPMPWGLNSHRVECKKVHFSWHQPSMTVWLNFKERGVAQKVHGRFNDGKSTVLDHVVKSSGPTGSSTSYRRNQVGWTVILTDVPGPATTPDVVRTIPHSIRPFHVEPGRASYVCDPGTANALIKTKLAQVGPLEWWEDVASPRGKRAKGKARFRDEGDAVKAVALLNGSTLPFHNKGRLTVQAVFSARFKVLGRIYEAVKAEVVAQSRVWAAKHVFFTPYEPLRATRVLTLEGENSSHVAEAKQALQENMAGKVAKIGDDILWSPSFGVNGDIYRRLKAVEQMLGIVITRNKRMSRLHLYGSPERCMDAQPLLASLAKEDSSTAGVIELDEHKFAWACLGGFKELVKVLGQKVIFDIISTPKRILVAGSKRDCKLALDMVTSHKEAVGPKKTSVTTADDCAICWTEAENPVQTRCKHTYCSDCFERFCLSDASATDNFHIRCEGDSSTCKKVLALDELQEHLSSNTLDEVLEASFAFYIRRRPEAFYYCPEADPGQVYRTSSSGVIFTCPNCLTAVCTSCHASHQDISCADHKELVSGGYAALKEAKQRLGIKDCPMCSTAIEKTDGCDHITCGGCRTHICWKCLATFGTGEQCYSHLEKGPWVNWIGIQCRLLRVPVWTRKPEVRYQVAR